MVGASQVRRSPSFHQDEAESGPTIKVRRNAWPLILSFAVIILVGLGSLLWLYVGDFSAKMPPIPFPSLKELKSEPGFTEGYRDSSGSYQYSQSYLSTETTQDLIKLVKTEAKGSGWSDEESEKVSKDVKGRSVSFLKQGDGNEYLRISVAEVSKDYYSIVYTVHLKETPLTEAQFWLYDQIDRFR